jgi:D-arabinose 1-dehydrogenase-like Zn-dependent alcohol dehydrogenase
MGGVSQYCLAVPDTPLIQETQDMNVPVNFFASSDVVVVGHDHSMSAAQINTVLALIAQGYGAPRISLELGSSVSLKQINAVFEMVEQAGGEFPIIDL